MRGGDEQGHAPTDRPHVSVLAKLAAEAAAIKLDKEPAIKKPECVQVYRSEAFRGSTCRTRSMAQPSTASIFRAQHGPCRDHRLPVFGGTVKSVDERAIAGSRGTSAGGQAPECRGGGG